jgi:hypothetical protein
LPYAREATTEPNLALEGLEIASEEAEYAIQNENSRIDAQRKTDSSGDDSDALSLFDPEDLDETLKDLTNEIQCLVDIGPILSSLPFDLNSHKSIPQYGIFEVSEYQPYCNRIADRFPKADRDLVLRLGKANWKRFLRLQAQRDNVAGNSEASIRDESHQTVVGTQFNDSGLGSSLSPSRFIATSSYAETVMTFSGTGGFINIPPIPADGRNGKAFSCVACGRKVTISNQKVWK